MALTFEAPPFYQPLVVPSDPRSPIAAKLPPLVGDVNWLRWFSNLTTQVRAAATTQASLRYRAQAAAIPVTGLPIGTVGSGLYRVSWYLRIAQAASSSSSVQVTIQWIDGGLTVTSPAAAVTANTTTTVQSGSLLIRSDSNQPISVSASYASVGATAMTFNLDVIVESVLQG